MRYALFASLTVFIGICTAAPGLPEKKDAIPPKKEPAEAEPFVTTALSKDGAIYITRQSTRFVDEVRTMQVAVDGKVMNINVTVKVPVTVENIVSLDPKTLEVKSPDGKVIETADVANALKEKKKVVVSPNGKPISEELLKANKDAIVIVVKPAK